MYRLSMRRDNAAIPHVTSAEHLRVAVQDLFVEPFLGHAKTVVLPRNRREVAAEQDEIGRIFARRRKAITESSASWKSIHSKPL